MRGRPTLAVAAAAALLLPSVARTAPGDLDPRFSSDGIATAFRSGGVATSIAVDSQGRTVIAGYAISDEVDLAVARFLPDGKPDPSFGGNGRARFDVGDADYAFDMVVLAGDGLALAGRSTGKKNDRAFVLRLTNAGKPRTLFGGGDGLVKIDFGKATQVAGAIAVSPGGRLVIGGYVSNGTTSSSALARLLPDGRLDDSFAGDGRMTPSLSTGAEQVHDVAVLADGSILAAGEAEVDGQPRFSLFKASSEGALDRTFANEGVRLTDMGPGADVANALAADGGGRIVLAGRASNAGRYDWGIARYDAAGMLDDTFGVKGKVVLEMTSSVEEATDVALSGGRIVVVGRIRGATSLDLGVVRLRAGGALDPDFGVGGTVLVDLYGSTDVGRGVALRPNGKIEVAGEAWRDAAPRFLAIRLLAT